jgi:hypothetical protein
VAAAALNGTTIEAPKSTLVTPTAPADPVPPKAPAFDYTHLGPHGAEVFSAIVAEEITHAVPAMEKYVVPR